MKLQDPEPLELMDNETYRLLFENMAEGCAYCRMLHENGEPRDWTYISVNAAFEKLTGLRDVTGKMVSEVIPGLRESDPELFEIYSRVSLTQKPERFEMFVKALNEWFSISVYSPKPEFFVAVFDIITERKQAEERLQQNRNMLAKVINSVPHSVFWKDRNSVYLGCNEVFARVAGFNNPEDIVGKTDHDLPWTKEETARYISDDREVMESGRPKLHFIEIVRHSDGVRWVDKNKIPLSDNNGRVYGVLGVFEDITEDKLAAEELQNLRTAVEQSANIIVITDCQGRIEYVNPAFEATTGFTAAEAIGSNPRILKSGKQNQEFYRNLWQTITSGRIWRGQLHNRRKDGSLYWESATISPVLDATGTILHFIAVKEDITDRKSLEANLLEALDRAESANKAKSEFLAVMSHELRTPLNGVLGYADLLAEALPDNDHKEYARTIRNSGEHLLQIVNDILDFSSIEKGIVRLESATVVLSNLVERSCQAIRCSAADKGLEFRCEMDPAVPEEIMGDERRVGQILINLLGNAVKFTSEGSIFLRITPGTDEDHPTLDFSVQDTGTGIPSHLMEMLFEPFTQVDSTLHRPYQGSGLGLAISKRLAEAMGGTISVISIQGKGSTFTFRIPIGLPVLSALDHKSGR